MKAIAFSFSESDDPIRQRVRNHGQAIGSAYVAAINLYKKLLRSNEKISPGTSLNESLRSDGSFLVKGALIVSERYDSNNNCEILLRVPLSGIKDNSKAGKKNVVDMESILNAYKYRGPLNQYAVDSKSAKEKWIDADILEIIAFGLPAHTPVKVRRRNTSYEAAVISAQSRALSILHGVTIEHNQMNMSGITERGRLIRYLYDDNDNCEVTLQFKAGMTK